MFCQKDSLSKCSTRERLMFQPTLSFSLLLRKLFEWCDYFVPQSRFMFCLSFLPAYAINISNNFYVDHVLYFCIQSTYSSVHVCQNDKLTQQLSRVINSLAVSFSLPTPFKYEILIFRSFSLCFLMFTHVYTSYDL